MWLVKQAETKRHPYVEMANIDLIKRKKERREFIGIEPAVGDTVGDVVGTAVGDAVGTVPMRCAVGGREAKVRQERSNPSSSCRTSSSIDFASVLPFFYYSTPVP